MENINNIFSNFAHNPYIGMLFIMLMILYTLILSMQLLKSNKVLVVAIAGAIVLGIYLFIVTTMMGVADDESVESLMSMKVWLTLAWNIFIFLLLLSLPIYVFSMVSTTFTNTRHYEGGKRLLLTSFLSLWGMTLLGIIVALAFIPILYLLRDMLELEGTNPADSSLLFGNILQYYSYMVLATIFLAIIFAILMNILHKYRHDAGEMVIDFMQRIKFGTRRYLNWVSQMVPYVLAGMLILLFNNYQGAFVKTATALFIFAAIFFAGLAIVYGLEFSIVSGLRRNKKELSKRKLKNKTWGYNLHVFSVQSAPIVYPVTVDYVKALGVAEPVVKTVPTLTTFMGYSMCGGFYPALIVMFTVVQPGAFLDGTAVNWESILITLSLMIPLIMIMTLGMTGVPGADVAIILGILSILGLNPTYFFTIYLIEPLLDKFRGIGNSMGFAAASVITDRLYEIELNAMKRKNKPIEELEFKEIELTEFEIIDEEYNLNENKTIITSEDKNGNQ